MDGAIEAFAAEVRRPEDELRLDRAALLIAAGENPDLDIEHGVARLDALAAGVRRLMPPGADAQARAHAIQRHLFTGLGFRGNEADYYDPRNSYLDQVLDRRTGIPISLSTVYLEVARRVGLEVAGVSYPRHFLVKYRDGAREWVVDPFHGGEEVAAGHLRARLAEGGATPDRALDYYLAAVTRRQILVRMLTNLKLIYLYRGDDGRALRIQEYLLAINPWSLEDIRDRGVLRARTGDVPGALTDLETYRAHAGPAEDVAAVHRLITRLREGERHGWP